MNPNITDSMRMDWLEEDFKNFRHINSFDMSGDTSYWSYWTTMKGRTRSKTLREAVDTTIEDTAMAYSQVDDLEEVLKRELPPYQKAIIRGLLQP